MTDMSKPRFWARPAFALILLPVLAVLLNLVYLTGGFYADDFLLINAIEQDPRPFSQWRGAWSSYTQPIPAFDHLWWKDPDFAAGFFRPIPSAVLELSLFIFGRNPLPLHLLSLLLHGAVGAMLYLLVRRLTGRHGLALLAGLFFVTCEDHSLGVGWIATNTDLLGALFITLALLWHAVWLQSRRSIALIGSWAAVILGLACKESAIAAPVAMILMSILMPHGRDEAFPRRLSDLGSRLIRTWRDPLTWLPAVIISLAYLAAYQVLALGVAVSLGYVNPLSDPIGFLSHMAVHLPILWLGTFTVFPLFLVLFIQEWQLPAAVAGVIVFVLWMTALRSFRHNGLIWWAVIVYLVALVPQTGTDASERGLYLPMIPASLLLASLVISIGRLARRLAPAMTKPSRWTRFMGWSTALTILVPGILISAARPFALLPGFARPEKEVLTALPYIRERKPDNTLVLSASSFFPIFYMQDILYYHEPRSGDVWPLSCALGVFSVQKTGDSSFVIRTTQPGWTDNAFARLMRTRPRMQAGRTYHLPILTATIEEITDDGRDVLAVRFDLARSLDDPRWLFLRWNQKRFEPIDLAALEIGQSVDLGDTSDLWKALM